MARSPRLVVPGQPVHLLHRGHNRQAVFFGEDHSHRFLSDLTQSAGKYRCAVHAYVLMTNHIHLFVTPGEGGSVSSMMQARVDGRSALAMQNIGAVRHCGKDGLHRG